MKVYSATLPIDLEATQFNLKFFLKFELGRQEVQFQLKRLQLRGLLRENGYKELVMH